MPVELLVDQVPVVTDLLVKVAEVLAGRPVVADFQRELGERRHLIDGSTDPVARRQNLSLDVDGVKLRVTHEDAWWNDHELASSSVRGSVSVEGRGAVSCWVEARGDIRWTGTGLSDQVSAAVAQCFGKLASR